MAAVSNSMTQNLSPKAQLTAHQSLKTAQATSFILPPAYLIYSIGKGQGLYVRKWMGFSIASVLAGAALGVGIGYARANSESDVDAAAQVNALVSVQHATFSTSPQLTHRGTTEARLRRTTGLLSALSSEALLPLLSSSDGHLFRS